MTINWHQLVSQTYLIDIDTTVLHPTDKALLIVGAVLVMLGIIFRLTSLLSPHQLAKIFWRRLSNWGLVIGLLEGLWFAFRYEGAVYLGSHLLAFIVLLVGLIWLLRILKYWARQYRKDIAQWQKDQLKQKYLSK